MTTETPWQNTHLPHFHKLSRDRECDVVVVDGGMTGLTAAYLLKKDGKKVCLLERGYLAAGDTGCTTAHLASVTDKRLSELVEVFGNDSARLIWEGGAAAVNTIEQIVGRLKIECDFHRVPGFLHAPLDSTREETNDLQADCDFARDFGFEAAFVPHVPGINRPGVRFANQALFHPLKYLARLATAIQGNGCLIYENTEVTEVQDGHYEIASYGTLIAHARLLGDAEAVTLLQQTLEEEKQTDQNLTELAESEVNIDAEEEDAEEE